MNLVEIISSLEGQRDEIDAEKETVTMELNKAMDCITQAITNLMTVDDTNGSQIQKTEDPKGP